MIPLEDRSGWAEALEGVPHAFWQTWDSCHAMAATSRLDTKLFCLDEDGVRIVCPLAERRTGEHADLVTPYGFPGFVGTGDLPSLPAHWRAFGQDAGYVCAYVAMHPVLSNDSYFAAEATSHRSVFVLDLEQDEETLFSRLSTNRRREIRKADAVEWLCSDQEKLAAFFVAAYPEFMASRRAASVYEFSEESLRALCDSRHTLLVGAEQNGGVRAASLFGYTAHAGEFVFNVSLPGAEAYSAPLIWAGVRELKARGVPSLNLGGGIREGDGVEQFKERFGPDRRPFRVVKDVFRPDVYRALCEEAGVDPESTTYFPAYRSPR